MRRHMALATAEQLVYDAGQHFTERIRGLAVPLPSPARLYLLRRFLFVCAVTTSITIMRSSRKRTLVPQPLNMYILVCFRLRRNTRVLYSAQVRTEERLKA